MAQNSGLNQSLQFSAEKFIDKKIPSNKVLKILGLMFNSWGIFEPQRSRSRPPPQSGSINSDLCVCESTAAAAASFVTRAKWIRRDVGTY